jgi:hypothetical protein
MDVLMKLLKKILIIGILTSTALTTNAGEFFTEQGSYWLGGEANFSSIGNTEDGERNNALKLAPIIRFFPSNSLFVGPAFFWNGSYSKYYTANVLGLGVDLGFAFGEKLPVIPYFRSGGLYNISTYDSKSINGFTIPIAGGVIIPLFDAIALQIEPSFYLNWLDGEEFNTFAISFGFCGKGKKSVISILNGIDIYTYYQ